MKSPGAVRKGRVELLRSSRDSLSAFSQGGSDLDESEELGTTKPFVHTLPSPYSRITAPRTPYHCSGHASDTTSVLSGELPPAMCKTALLYNRSSMVSSGYESMLRDSEATISSSSTHNSISDQSCSLGAAKGARSTKKRTTIGEEFINSVYSRIKQHGCHCIVFVHRVQYKTPISRQPPVAEEILQWAQNAPGGSGCF